MTVLVDEKGNIIKPYIVECQECQFFRPYKEAPGCGDCISPHTFDGTFKKNDFCSYGKKKPKEKK